jgi:DNA-binding NarL/FixJ family response regulator
MADNVAVPANFDRYHQIALDYQECVVRCQQALDQLEACKRELRQVASYSADLPHCVAPDLKIEHAALKLSHRELQVFMLIGQGLTTPQIAEQLGVVISTVETYRERLKSKLNLESGPALNRQAVLWLVGPRIEDRC